MTNEGIVDTGYDCNLPRQSEIAIPGSPWFDVSRGRNKLLFGCWHLAVTPIRFRTEERDAEVRSGVMTDVDSVRLFAVAIRDGAFAGLVILLSGFAYGFFHGIWRRRKRRQIRQM